MALLPSWWIPCPYSKDFEKNRFRISEENSSTLCGYYWNFFSILFKVISGHCGLPVALIQKENKGVESSTYVDMSCLWLNWYNNSACKVLGWQYCNQVSYRYKVAELCNLQENSEKSFLQITLTTATLSYIGTIDLHRYNRFFLSF